MARHRFGVKQFIRIREERGLSAAVNAASNAGADTVELRRQAAKVEEISRFRRLFPVGRQGPIAFKPRF